MPGQTYYLTKIGAKKIQQEYEKLLDLRNKKVRGEDVPMLLHSEEVNPDYLLFQEDMELLEGKIVEYKAILENLEVITFPAVKERSIVQLGAVVTIDFDGEIDEFMIVGTLEADPVEKKISNESPIGQALLGSKVGDQVVPDVSLKQRTCRILKIEYKEL